MPSEGDMPDGEQRETIAFLLDPASHKLGLGTVEHLETHASHVFLAGDRALKLKRAVRYDFLDYSSVEKRRDACRAELALNRRTAPELYLDVLPIVRRAGGELALGGSDVPIDWVVVMRRFDQAALFDRMAAEGRLTAALVSALTRSIVAFHRDAEAVPEFGGAAAIADVIAVNAHSFERSRFAPEQAERLRRRALDALAGVAALLDRRRGAGKVRRCHGDLHLGNVCLVEGRPTLFDCIEFNPAFACIDVLYDLAFLVMDLIHRGCAGFASQVFNEYLDRSDEADGLPAIPLFLSLRAAVRAHVAALAGNPAAASTAGAYLDLAHRLLDTPPARLVAVGGLSGTGKSTLAALVAPELGAAPGARILRSDVLRKRLYGTEFEAKLPEEAYSRAAADRVYAELRDQARRALACGRSVVIDAVAARLDERKSFADVAREAGVPFNGLWLEASADALRTRLEQRRGDVSDATPAVLERQLGYELGAIDWTRLDASADRESILAAARRALGSN